MFRFIVLTALLAIASAGIVQFPDGKIVGGSATTIEDHPYQVSIQIKGSHFCGGSLIQGDVVLTAAHCFGGTINIEDYTVRVGSTNRKEGGQVVQVKSYRNHPSYNAETHANDVAVLRLGNNVSLNSAVRTIELATVTPKTGASAIVSGWGVKQSGGLIAPADLLEAEVKIVDYKECGSSQYRYAKIGKPIDSSMVCAEEESKDACQGDSGGPLVSGDKLVGVVSWGYGCAIVGFPGVYADVPHHQSWIEETAKSL